MEKHTDQHVCSLKKVVQVQKTLQQNTKQLLSMLYILETGPFRLVCDHKIMIKSHIYLNQMS